MKILVVSFAKSFTGVLQECPLRVSITKRGGGFFISSSSSCSKVPEQGLCSGSFNGSFRVVLRGAYLGFSVGGGVT